jgi:hypothetical protein
LAFFDPGAMPVPMVSTAICTPLRSKAQEEVFRGTSQAGLPSADT